MRRVISFQEVLKYWRITSFEKAVVLEKSTQNNPAKVIDLRLAIICALHAFSHINT